MILDLAFSPSAWFAFGMLLGMLEILLPGFVLVGFGIGAVGVAGTLWLGIAQWLSGIEGASYLLILWALLSLCASYLLRRCFSATNNAKAILRDINEDPYRGARD